jgi:hypothetical protein
LYERSFAGIRPADVPSFVVAQPLGASAATVLFRWLVPSLPSEAKDVVFPHVDIGRQIMTNAAAWMPGFPCLGRAPPECVVASVVLPTTEDARKATRVFDLRVSVPRAKRVAKGDFRPRSRDYLCVTGSAWLDTRLLSIAVKSENQRPGRLEPT